MGISYFIKKGFVVLLCSYIFCFSHFCYFYCYDNGGILGSNEVSLDKNGENNEKDDENDDEINNPYFFDSANSNTEVSTEKIDLFNTDIENICDIIKNNIGEIQKDNVNDAIKQFKNFVINREEVDNIEEVTCRLTKGVERCPFKNFVYKKTEHNKKKCINFFTKYDGNTYGIRFYECGDIECGIFVRNLLFIKSYYLHTGFHYNKAADKWDAIIKKGMIKKIDNKIKSMYNGTKNFCKNTKRAFNTCKELYTLYNDNKDKIEEAVQNVRQVFTSKEPQKNNEDSKILTGENIEKVCNIINEGVGLYKNTRDDISKIVENVKGIRENIDMYNNENSTEENKNSTEEDKNNGIVKKIVKFTDGVKNFTRDMNNDEEVKKHVNSIRGNLKKLNEHPENIQNLNAYNLSNINAMLKFKNVEKKLRDFFCYRIFCCKC